MKQTVFHSEMGDITIAVVPTGDGDGVVILKQGDAQVTFDLRELHDFQDLTGSICFEE